MQVCKRTLGMTKHAPPTSSIPLPKSRIPHPTPKTARFQASEKLRIEASGGHRSPRQRPNRLAAATPLPDPHTIKVRVWEMSSGEASGGGSGGGGEGSGAQLGMEEEDLVLAARADGVVLLYDITRTSTLERCEVDWRKILRHCRHAHSQEGAAPGAEGGGVRPVLALERPHVQVRDP